jgi:hypothetical protein
VLKTPLEIGQEKTVYKDFWRHFLWKTMNPGSRKKRLYAHQANSRRYPTGYCAMAQPRCVRLRNLGRNALRGPDFVWSDFYLTKWFALTERLRLRFDTQFFNVFNHPDFGRPSMVLAGIPGKPSTQTGFGALTFTTSPPTGLLGVGLGGDSTPRMIAFQLRLEF